MVWNYSEEEFVKIKRKIVDWEWYSDPVCRAVYMHCIIVANWKDGNWKGNKYCRGQLFTSISELSKTLGFSNQRIRTALKRLELTNYLTIKTTNKFSIITVLRYDENQCINKQTNKQLTNNQQTTNKQLTTDIRSIEIEEDKKQRNSSLSNDDELVGDDW